jgi:hypothetical protein
MKFKKIVGFGDSWMYGDELLDPKLLAEDPSAHTCFYQNDQYRHSHNFLGLLASHYELDFENFGIPGGSLQSEIWTLLWWLEHEPEPDKCIVLVGHTDQDRMSFYNPKHKSYSNDPAWNRFVHTAWTEATDDVVHPSWKNFMKQFMVLSDCAELGRLNYQQAVQQFDGASLRYRFPLLQFDIMPRPTGIRLPTHIFNGMCYTLYFREHPANRDRALYCKHGHPNERGHELIRDMLIPEIDKLF